MSVTSWADFKQRLRLGLVAGIQETLQLAFTYTQARVPVGKIPDPKHPGRKPMRLKKSGRFLKRRWGGVIVYDAKDKDTIFPTKGSYAAVQEYGSPAHRQRVRSYIRRSNAAAISQRYILKRPVKYPMRTKPRPLKRLVNGKIITVVAHNRNMSARRGKYYLSRSVQDAMTNFQGFVQAEFDRRFP